MNGIYGINEAEAYDEVYDEAYDEARRGRGRRPPTRPVPTPPRGSSYRRPPPMQGRPVTRKELADALRIVDTKIGTNSKAIQMVDGRGRALAAAQGRMAADLRKETATRTRAIVGVRKDLQSTREIAGIAPLLGNLVGNPEIGAILPLLLLSQDVSAEPPSAGTSGGIFGGGGGGLGGILPLVLLVGALGGGSFSTNQ
jgi:hypothetical protein